VAKQHFEAERGKKGTGTKLLSKYRKKSAIQS
jgi:hypothetical protein